MPVETAADLASLFDEDEFAEVAVYTGTEPGAVGVPCSVIVDRGQGRRMFRAADHEVATSERNLVVRATAPGSGGLPAVVRDGLFAMADADGVPTGEVFRVAGMPSLDQTARLWSAELLLEE
jgi:hypothetical protein